jgi:hypothetical protein
MEHPYAFQLGWLDVEMVEKANAFSEQERRDVNVDLIHQPEVQTLLQDTCRAHNDIFIACRLLCLTNCAFHTIGDKSKG